MTKTVVQPTDYERDFNMEELFFSVTDPSGKITFANEVFTRISAYDEKELIGRPHNIIRHPDMPRALFHVMWEYLNSGKPVAAYVKNLAKDGAYYWVIALVFSYDQGFISIRLKPGSPVFGKIQSIYEDTLSYERQQSEERGDKEGMIAAVSYLQQKLRENGYDSYDEFMWEALEQEMRNRDELLQRKGFKRKNHTDAIPGHILKFESHLIRLFDHLKTLEELHDKLLEHSRYILNLSNTIRLLSLNAQVSTARLDGEGESLSAVAGQMGDQSHGGTIMLADMQQHVTSLSKLLDKANFDIIFAKLQVEMTTIFLNEVHVNGENRYLSDIPVPQIIRNLHDSFTPRLLKIAEEVGRIPSSLGDLKVRVGEIERFLYVLRFIHSTGKIEIARLSNAGAFANTFDQLIREVNDADSKLKELSGHIEENQKMNPVFIESERVFASAKRVSANGYATGVPAAQAG